MVDVVRIPVDVLQLLVDGHVDKSEVVSRLARYHPEILVKLVKLDELTYEIQKAYNDRVGGRSSGNKVKAIKAYRTLTGTSLMDAKNAVETMMENNEVWFEPSEE